MRYPEKWVQVTVSPDGMRYINYDDDDLPAENGAYMLVPLVGLEDTIAAVARPLIDQRGFWIEDHCEFGSSIMRDATAERWLVEVFVPAVVAALTGEDNE